GSEVQVLADDRGGYLAYPATGEQLSVARDVPASTVELSRSARISLSCIPNATAGPGSNRGVRRLEKYGGYVANRQTGAAVGGPRARRAARVDDGGALEL